MKKYLCMIIVIVLGTANSIVIQASAGLSEHNIKEYIYSIYQYEREQVAEPSYGSVGGEWLITGVSRYGTDKEYIDTYKENLKRHILNVNGVLSARKYTEYARVVIALSALEENPQNFAGYNLLQPLAEFDQLVGIGPNAMSYTLIALDCKDYDIPKPKKDYNGTVTTRERLIATLMSNQLKDGGWTFVGQSADIDMTAMAVQALAPYYKKEEKVKEALDRAIEKLGSMQQPDGGYKTGNRKTCESTAQVLVALSEMRISVKDKRFVKNGNTIIDGLMQYYQNGAFCHLQGGSINQMATEQAMYALVAYYRSISGMNRLYDMSDGMPSLVLKPQQKGDEPSAGSEIATRKNKIKKEITKKVKKAKAKDASQSLEKPLESRSYPEITSVKNRKTKEKQKNDRATTKVTKETILKKTEVSSTEKITGRDGEEQKTPEEVEGGPIIVCAGVMFVVSGIVVYGVKKNRK